MGFDPTFLGPNNTYLQISPISGLTALELTPYSARGISQTLEPMTGVNGSGQALGTWLRRDINGNLVDLSSPRLRKYISEVTCRDSETPCLDDAWLGLIVQIDCACELSYVTGATPQRPAVPGSTRVEGHISFYRPQLVCMVAQINSKFEEYQGSYTWRVRLAEV